jgi:hypothetical protein
MNSGTQICETYFLQSDFFSDSDSQTVSFRVKGGDLIGLMPQNYFATFVDTGALLRVDATLSIRRVPTRDLCTDEDIRDAIPFNQYSSIVVAKVSDWSELT